MPDFASRAGNAAHSEFRSASARAQVGVPFGSRARVIQGVMLPVRALEAGFSFPRLTHRTGQGALFQVVDPRRSREALYPLSPTFGGEGRGERQQRVPCH